MDKKAELTQVAFALFYARGANSVGINEVLQRSGIAKKTLYHHFVGKEALLFATLELRDRQFLAWLEGRLSQAKPGQQAVSALFHGLAAWFDHQEAELGPFHGCYFVSTAALYPDTQHENRRYCQQHKRRVRAMIQQHLGDRFKHREALLDAIVLLMEGAIASAQINRDSSSATRCLPVVATLFSLLEMTTGD
ncbi:TetR/AcrR family transcriptional regulator [Ferrimonas pelagia]|uniref:TetR/AcrR family transcriptional regulator n=1 Tax=Ferrimonas pelagia TaxID=1177826 RepID=A0ABP9FRM2_9GAMM